MRRNLILATILVAAALVGCSDNPGVVSPADPANTILPVSAEPLAVPADAVIDSAHFYLYANASDTQSVQIHRVNADWTEGDVTWTSFAGAFDATPLTTMLIEDVGWYSFDVTGQAQGWFDSTLDNFGFFIQPVETDTGLSVFDSREATGNHPYLEVFYTTFEGEAVETLMAVGDAQIYSGDPDDNFGTETSLIVQRETGVDSVYQSLVRFEFPVEIRFASIGDLVWNDENMNGLQDEGEMGMAGIEVNLYDCEDTWLATTTTDDAGMYGFDELHPGEYYLEVVRPNGYIFTHRDAGNDDTIDSDVDAFLGRTDCFEARPGEVQEHRDAGLYAFDGCTYSKGYWKNHAGFGPQDDVLSPLLPIWLGNDDGDKSLAVDNAEMAVALLHQHEYGHPSNGITKLYAQLLAAKLNIANFANSEDVENAIAEADGFLADHDWMDWDMLEKEDRRMVLDWKDLFDEYNNGETGPGHCDDGDDDYDDSNEDMSISEDIVN